jgi:FeS assembly SUF system protein
MEGKTVETEKDPVAVAMPEPKPDARQAAAPADPVAEAASVSALPVDEDERLRAEIVAALKTVYDPEIPADVYELGLIYDIAIDADRNVAIAMTLTAPGCPVAGEMPKWVENAVNAVAGVNNTSVSMTFDPPWDMSRMSDEARLALNMF